MGGKPRKEPERRLVTQRWDGTLIYHGLIETAACELSADETFRCPSCHRLCCWCFGCGDSDVCDDCWGKRT